jgi:hypothetical protein
LRIDERGDRVRQDDGGIGEDATPIARMVRAVAQIDIKMNPQSTTTAEKDGGPIGSEPRTVRCQEQIGLELIAQ